jgi:hypothetical protein
VSTWTISFKVHMIGSPAGSLCSCVRQRTRARFVTAGAIDRKLCRGLHICRLPLGSWGGGGGAFSLKIIAPLYCGLHVLNPTPLLIADRYKIYPPPMQSKVSPKMFMDRTGQLLAGYWILERCRAYPVGPGYRG